MVAMSRRAGPFRGLIVGILIATLFWIGAICIV